MIIMSLQKYSYKSPLYIKNKGFLFVIYRGKCGINECNNKADECHHNNRNNQYHHTSNLIPLCKSCHQLVHSSNAFFDNLPELHAKKLQEYVESL